MSTNVIGAAVGLDLVSADVLSDPSALGLDDLGLANSVQKRRLAVVDVTQDRDDRRAGHELLGTCGGSKDVEQIVFGRTVVDDLELDAELQGQHDGRLVVQGGVDGGELVH